MSGNIVSASFRAAFNSWWVAVGILASSITGFRLLINATHIRLANIATYVMVQYHHWVHLPAYRFFQWVHLPKLPDWSIDVALIWLIVGGIVLRSAQAIRGSAIRRDKWVISKFGLWNFLLGKWWTLPLFIGFCLLLWPLAVLFMLAEPYIHESEDGGVIPNGLIMCRIGETVKPDGRKCWTYYQYDMRIIMAAQLLAALSVITTWVSWNALSVMYG